MKHKQSKIPAIIETIFDITYLCTVFTVGGILLTTALPGGERALFGITALILGAGDLFHLLPRIYALWNGGTQKYPVSLGIGKLITSITMTIFYLLLWEIGLMHYNNAFAARFTALVYLLAAIRILLCLLPQNKWTASAPPLRWGIVRNIPFFLIGIAVMLLYALSPSSPNDGLAPLCAMTLLSFLFYLPVVLFAERCPKIGMLMLPKTCAYVAMVWMGFSLV